jgi:hypothetical protein
MTLVQKIGTMLVGPAGLPRETLRASGSLYRPRPLSSGATMSFTPRKHFASEAVTPKPSIKLQILLRHDWRTSQGVEKAHTALRSLGMTPTVGGLATISAEIEPAKFEEVFGVTVTETAPQPPGGQEFGRSGGYISPDLKVPTALSDYVESISAAPGHIYLQK